MDNTEGTYTLEQLKAEHPGLVAQIHAEVVASVDAKAALAAEVTAERARLLGIYGHAEAEGRRELALRLCHIPTMSVAEAVEILTSTPKGTNGTSEFARRFPNAAAQAEAAERARESEADEAQIARIAAIANAEIEAEALARTRQ